ncbi:hypothetical protein [Gracilibacillus kekensis]|uniref:Uncharacterized protein n=1 Tax=Gracilibacillus kekensis TaxID=1027249 RepID=A0A1M7MU14_9BACI|nr:hypothetical protein [Gracilibacillus kekensis]SHM94586.1 hypothetical protein SAMN05216179_1368 [Gracilibacillus kekensis]
METAKKKKFDIKIFFLIAIPLSIIILIMILPNFNLQSDLEKNIIEPHFNTVIDGDYEIDNISKNMKARAGVSDNATIYEVIILQDDLQTTYEIIIEDDKVVSSKITENR